MYFFSIISLTRYNFRSSKLVCKQDLCLGFTLFPLFIFVFILWLVSKSCADSSSNIHEYQRYQEAEWESWFGKTVFLFLRFVLRSKFKQSVTNKERSNLINVSKLDNSSHYRTLSFQFFSDVQELNSISTNDIILRK